MTETTHSSDVTGPQYADATVLIATLAEVPDTMETLAQRAPADRTRPGAASAVGADAWNASQLIGHLCDASRIYGGRMRRVVFEEQPALATFDQNAEVEHAGYRYMPLDAILAEYRLHSAGTVEFLRALPAEAWARVGVHSERGRMTLREIVVVEMEHERGHVADLAKTLGLEA